MTDDDEHRNSFEDVARALAQEIGRAVERIAEIDVDELARTAGAEAERARLAIDDLGRWLREQTDAFGRAASSAAEPWEPAAAAAPAPSPPAGEDPLRSAGPHPLDLATADQGLALAALDSGRWRLEPGTSALAVHGEGVRVGQLSDGKPGTCSPGVLTFAALRGAHHAASNSSCNRSGGSSALVARVGAP